MLMLVLFCIRPATSDADLRNQTTTTLQFCGHSECPPYTVDEDREKYEIRTYDAGVWAVTNVTDNKYELAYTKASARKCYLETN